MKTLQSILESRRVNFHTKKTEVGRKNVWKKNVSVLPKTFVVLPICHPGTPWSMWRPCFLEWRIPSFPLRLGLENTKKNTKTRKTHFFLHCFLFLDCKYTSCFPNSNFALFELVSKSQDLIVLQVKNPSIPSWPSAEAARAEQTPAVWAVGQARQIWDD